MVITDNQITNFETGLQLMENEMVYATNNKINNCANFGIYSEDNMVNASCNEIDMGLTEREQAIGIAHIRTNILGNSNAWENASFRSNCISECKTAFYISNLRCNNFDAIYNNFLYNYQSYGIYASNVTLQIGSNLQVGSNSFVSNNHQSGLGSPAVDIYSDNCNGTAVGNFGILNLSSNITVSGSGKFNSTATCAKQVNDRFTSNPHSTNQQYTVLEMCNEFDVNGRALLHKTIDGITLNNNWFVIFNNSNVSNHYNIALSLINALNSDEIDGVFNKLKGAEFKLTNDVLFLEVYYLKNKNNTVEAISKLNEIIAINDNEADLVAILAIELDLLYAKKGLHELSVAQQNTLKNIDAKQAINSAMARDLLQASNGKHDYRFKPTQQLTTTTEGKIISLLENSLLIYPNPASNDITLQMVNATDANAIINIYDAMGQRVFQQQANIKTGKITIDISQFASGIYHVQLIGANSKSLSQSFIKK